MDIGIVGLGRMGACIPLTGDDRWPWLVRLNGAPTSAAGSRR